MKSISSTHLTDTQRRLLICLALVIVTTAVYWQVKDHQFINYDDNMYVTENPQVQAGLTVKGLKWAFTTSHAGYCHPLTWFSHMLDVQLFGMRPGWHHLMNLVLHVANTLLLFLIFHRMTKALRQSAFVAALFALHPLHVESVAWVAERKDVLSTFFWMLTMGAYAFYVERPRFQRYLPVFLLFALGLMAKPMLVTLPFVLLLMDYWPLERYYPEKQREVGGVVTSPPENRKRKKKKMKEAQRKVIAGAEKPERGEIRWAVLRPLIVEKIPLFGLSAVSSVITFINQQTEGAMLSLQKLPLDARIANSLIAYVSYLGKIVWPENLAVFYPHPGMVPPWQVLGAGAILATITLAVIWKTKRFPYLTVGWLWYLGMLVPVIGLVQVGSQAIADRYTYLPYVGIFLMTAWTVPDVIKKWRYRPTILAILAFITVSIFSFITWTQLSHWQNNSTLFNHALEVTKDNHIAYYNLGTSLQDEGRLEDAILHYKEALRIMPDHAGAHNNLGVVMRKQGRIKEAIEHYSMALKNDPNNAEAHHNMGNALLIKGKTEQAIQHYTEAIRIKPDYVRPYVALGNVLASQGKYNDAMDYYQKALQINSETEEAHFHLGTLLLSQAKIEEALSHLQAALRTKPDYPEVHYHLGNIMVSRNLWDEAVFHFREAVRYAPGWSKAQNNLGSALLLQKKSDEAIFHFREALRLEPDYRIARDNLRDALKLQDKKR